MKVAFYMNCVSAHQLPLAKEVAELVGTVNFCYVDAGEKGQSYQAGKDTTGIQVKGKGEGEQWLEGADLMLTGMRDLELFERRAGKGLKTFYSSERWLKPIRIKIGGEKRWRWRVVLPGSLRLLVPGYRRMVKRFVRWANGDDGARVLAMGPWAKRDFLKIGVRAEKIVDWGYFVAPSVIEVERRDEGGQRNFSILWCGRMLDWKRVDAIIRAVKKVERKGGGGQRWVSLTIVGDGPERERLQRMALSYTSGKDSASPLEIEFLPGQPMERVRELMREHDLYVLASDAQEGWGAVVNEALEEGMMVVGTFEAGASAALLPKERLYHAGDWKALAGLIEKEMAGTLPPCSIGEWTAARAAERLLRLKG